MTQSEDRPASTGLCRRVTVIFLTALAALLLLLLTLWLGSPPDPLFEGNHLSSLLSEAYRPPGQRVEGNYPRDHLAAKAVGALGTNAVPLLRTWLAYERNPNLMRLHDLAAWRFHFARPIDPASAAAQASAFLGTNGIEMLLPLLQQITNRNHWLAFHSARSLEKLCLDIKPPNEATLRSLTDANASLLQQVSTDSLWPNEQFVRNSVTGFVAQAIRNYDQGSLLQHLSKVRSRQADWLHSARVLSRQRKYPEFVIPVLQRELNHLTPPELENALLAMRNYGPAARHLTSNISPFLSHGNQNVRAAAREAINAISNPQ